VSAAKPQPLEPWELVGYLLQRIKVPGGWVYRTTDDATGHPAMVFVPFPSPLDIGAAASEDPR
jgi:hypothetical protein